MVKGPGPVVPAAPEETFFDAAWIGIYKCLFSDMLKRAYQRKVELVDEITKAHSSRRMSSLSAGTNLHRAEKEVMSLFKDTNIRGEFEYFLLMKRRGLWRQDIKVRLPWKRRKEAHKKVDVLLCSTKNLCLKESLILVVLDCVTKTTGSLFECSGGGDDSFHSILHELRFVVGVLGVLGRHCRETYSSRKSFLRTGS